MADFSIVDRRGTSRPPEPTARSPLMPPGVTVRRAKEEAGYTGLPFQNPNRNKSSDERTLAHLRASKLKASRMSRTGMVNGAAGSGLQMATGRPRDPMWYWKQNNLPFNFMDPNELARIREFCNTPDAPITMWDGSTKLLGAIGQGDVVKGWDYGFTPYPGEANYLSVFSTYTTNGGQQRRYVPSTVLAVNTRTAPIVQVTLASGTRLTCTPDHQWANPLYATVIEANAPYSNTPSADAAREYLPAEVGRNLLSVTEAMQDRIVAIEPAGTSQVISMQTTTGNYVAWGYASKNCRLLYVSHPLIAACTDIFAKFPLQGIHFECKDEELTTFYSDLFLDQLKYEDHLLRLNREYWLVGETFSLGGWNDTLGIWEGDQVINPDNVDVETQLFLDEPRYLMQLPDSLRTILQTRAPRWQYQQLIQAYPELVNFVSQDDRLPVSDVILQHMKFEADTFSNRGIPILMRGMRTIIQEEMLNAALDSIADRLYTPLILTKLGAKASDLGTTVPWIPDIDEMEEFNFALDSALAADFRALTYHWAIDMQPVFGRENVPDLSADFERIDERLLMVWGLSRTMLTGASAGETYAADALNRDVVTQLMSHDQRMLQQFVRSRGEIVAEAREHFDYEVRGGRKYLITEEIYEVDPESREGKIVQVPKLLVPDLKFRTLNLADEQVERDFLEALNESGVPVPYKARVQGVGMDFDEMVEQRSAEEVQLVVVQGETDRKKYLALKKAGLPIPDELRQKFDPKAIQMDAQQQPMPGEPSVTPALGQQVLDLPGLAPTQDDIQAAQQDGEEQEAMLPPDVDEDQDGEADTEELPQEGDDVPPESNEQRKRMPKAAALRRFGIREVTDLHYEAPDDSEEQRLRDRRPSGRFAAPRHQGMRYHLAPYLRPGDTVSDLSSAESGNTD